MIDENGNLQDGWKGVLPEDLQGSGVLDTVENITQLAKMAVDGRQLASTSIRVPNADAAEDAKKTFREDLMKKVPDLMFKPQADNPDSFKETMKVLGMPDAVDGYELPELPDPIADNIKGLAGKAHEAGLTKSQFSQITDGILEDFKANTEAAVGRIEQERSALKGEWGDAFDQKVETVAHFAKQTGFTDDFVEAVKQGQLSSTDMKAMDNVIKGYEGGAVEIGRQAGNPDVRMTPDEAEGKLDEIMSNKEHAFWDAANPTHDAAVKKVVELTGIADSGREKTEVDRFREAL